MKREEGFKVLASKEVFKDIVYGYIEFVILLQFCQGVCLLLNVVALLVSDRNGARG